MTLYGFTTGGEGSSSMIPSVDAYMRSHYPLHDHIDESCTSSATKFHCTSSSSSSSTTPSSTLNSTLVILFLFLSITVMEILMVYIGNWLHVFFIRHFSFDTRPFDFLHFQSQLGGNIDQTPLEVDEEEEEEGEEEDGNTSTNTEEINGIEIDANNHDDDNEQQSSTTTFQWLRSSSSRRWRSRNNTSQEERQEQQQQQRYSRWRRQNKKAIQRHDEESRRMKMVNECLVSRKLDYNQKACAESTSTNDSTVDTDTSITVSPTTTRIARTQQSDIQICSETQQPQCCPICLKNYENGDELSRPKSCTHEFHQACIIAWLVHHHNDTCPCCRQDVFQKSTTSIKKDDSSPALVSSSSTPLMLSRHYRDAWRRRASQLTVNTTMTQSSDDTTTAIHGNMNSNDIGDDDDDGVQYDINWEINDDGGGATFYSLWYLY